MLRQEVLLATSDSGTLSVLQIDAARRRMVCIEQVHLPLAAVFPQLWSGQTAQHTESRHVYGHYLSVHASGTAIAVASLDNRVAVLPVLDAVQHGRLFELDASPDALSLPNPSASVAKVIKCATGHAKGTVADMAFVDMPAQHVHGGVSARGGGPSLVHVAVLLLLQAQVPLVCINFTPAPPPARSLPPHNR